MKNIFQNKVSLALIALVLIATSCKKEFLDKQPYDQVSLDDAILSESDMTFAVNGMYSTMRTSGYYGRTFPMMGDIMADNVYISQNNSGRYLAFNNYVILSTNGEANELWTNAYTTILRANQVILSSVPSSANVNQLRGEAHAVRALMYFDLIRIFARPYSSSNVNGAGVPLVFEYDPNAQPPRNTIGEVYSQIISDLNSSITLMTAAKSSQYFSPYVAKALLAKVYQYMGDWTKAMPLANEVVNSSGYKLTDSAGYVNYWKNPGSTTLSETLFEICIDATNNNGTNSLAAMYIQQGYGDALIDSNFYKSFSSSDVRSLLQAPGYHHGQPALRCKKYQNQYNTADKDDAKVLRLSEIYLLLAEAYYNLGDEPNALLYLNKIAQKRQPSFAGYASTGTALLDDITNERRKELAYEGNRFFDMNRLGLDIVRGLQYPSNALFIPMSDYRRILPIPQIEIDANPNIAQNPGY